MAYHTFHGVELELFEFLILTVLNETYNDGRVTFAFIGQAIRGEDLTILRWNKHAFCYVDDQVEGIL
jgi:hypothetical protein